MSVNTTQQVNTAPARSLARRMLDEGWTLTIPVEAQGVPHGLPERIEATVPGCVHVDLLNAGLITDPYVNLNELTQDWIGRQHWLYSSTFECAELGKSDRHELVFEGLDTVAVVTLNGAEILRSENMHRTYRVDVSDLLQESNELSVRFESVHEYLDRRRLAVGELPTTYPQSFNNVRKMASNFGWDWGPTLVTAGIWRPIWLESWSETRIDEVVVGVDVLGVEGVATFDVRVRRETHAQAVLTLVAEVAGVRTEVAVDSDRVRLDVKVLEPNLWWPHDLGDQPLYEARVELLDSDGICRDVFETRIGFRSVELDRSEDRDGSAFRFIINGVPIFVRGANWITDDCFPTRVRQERYRTRIGQATAANINLLRVWGGGIYESEDFYRACDEMGVLVWQDFLFSCAAYPEDERFIAEIEAEARDNVARLSRHSSLIVWNGNNECIWGFHDWGWQKQLEGRPWGSEYYFEILPRVIAEVDPSRPYSAGSPFSNDPSRHPNDPAHGTTHIWDVWNERDYVAYREYRPRFASEFGFQAPATMSSIKRSLHERPLSKESRGMLHHQRATDGNLKLERGLEPHLPVPRDFDMWHFATQLNQAAAVTLGIEHFRSLRPHCMGTIVWQLNDCWPVTSWSAIDGYGRKKPMWYALRRSYAPRLMTFQPGEFGGVVAHSVNDSGTPWREPVTVERRTFSGELLASESQRMTVDRFSSSTVHLSSRLITPASATEELLVARSASGHTAFWYFAEPKYLSLPAPGYEVAFERSHELVHLTVLATTFLRDVSLFADRVFPDAEVSDALITLFPGESFTFDVSGLPDGASLDELSSCIVSMNDLLGSVSSGNDQ